MRRFALLPIAAAAACGTAEDPSGDAAVLAAVQTANLTGLYEGRAEAGDERSRLCILDRGAGNARFGLVAATPAGSCGGEGAALRIGAVLRLVMAGDERCEIEAAIDGARVAFPARVAPGCAYYCAPGATLAELALEKVGGTAQDAMRARDQVGDPLCG